MPRPSGTTAFFGLVSCYTVTSAALAGQMGTELKGLAAESELVKMIAESDKVVTLG